MRHGTPLMGTNRSWPRFDDVIPIKGHGYETHSGFLISRFGSRGLRSDAAGQYLPRKRHHDPNTSGGRARRAGFEHDHNCSQGLLGRYIPGRSW